LLQHLLRRDVPRRSNQARGATARIPDGRAMLACPMQRSVGVEIPHLADKPGCVASKMIGHGAAVAREILWMNAIQPVLRSRHVGRRKSQGLVDAGRIEDLVGRQVETVDAFIDRIHGERVAFFTLLQGALAFLAVGYVCNGTNQTNGASREIPDRLRMVLNPAEAAGLVANTIYRRQHRRLALEMRK